MSAIVEARFWERVDKTGDCWLWTGSRDRKRGYGMVTVGSRTDDTRRCTLAHRVAYELSVGHIPAGLVIHHRCCNPPCVNPAHLEAVTQRENILLGVGPTAHNARQTHCIRGHPFDDANTLFYSNRRFCRGCARLRRQAVAKGRFKTVCIRGHALTPENRYGGTGDCIACTHIRNALTTQKRRIRRSNLQRFSLGDPAHRLEGTERAGEVAKMHERRSA